MHTGTVFIDTRAHTHNPVLHRWYGVTAAVSCQTDVRLCISVFSLLRCSALLSVCLSYRLDWREEGLGARYRAGPWGKMSVMGDGGGGVELSKSIHNQPCPLPTKPATFTPLSSFIPSPLSPSLPLQHCWLGYQTVVCRTAVRQHTYFPCVRPLYVGYDIERADMMYGF